MTATEEGGAGSTGGPVTDAELFRAVLAAVDPIVQAARQHGPLPPMRSRAFLEAPLVMQRAGLLVLGEMWLVGDGLLDEWLTADYSGGRYHRPHHLIPCTPELQRRRWPPTGDRELWIKYGPQGPPAEEPAA